LTRTLPYALAQFLVVAFQWMSMLFLPLHFKAEGVSETGVGVLISVFSLSTLVLVLPLGILSDRLPPRPMMAAGAAVAFAAYALAPGVQGVGWLAVVVALAGAGFTLSSISLYSLFFKRVGDQRRGAEVSLFHIGGIIGAGLASWCCGELVQATGSTAVVFPLGAACAAGWAAATLLLPPTRSIAFPILEYGRDLRQPRTWLLIAIMFVTASHAGFEQTGYTLLQTEIIGLTAGQVGLVFFVLSLWMCAITVWTGNRHDRVGGQPVLWMGLALVISGGFMAASGSAAGVWDFTVYRVLHTAGDSVFNLLILVVASLIFPRRRAGGAFAFALTVRTASIFLFANLGGLVGEVFGFDRAFHLSGSIEVAGGLMLLVCRRRLRTIFLIDRREPR
jgi:MFS family permease